MLASWVPIYIYYSNIPSDLITYLNLTSLHKHSITVAPPKECPIMAILHRSIEF